MGMVCSMSLLAAIKAPESVPFQEAFVILCLACDINTKGQDKGKRNGMENFKSSVFV